jgi:glucan phosphoethanolaminetransferase (alkaline phosphatase superfamily)
LRLWLNTLLKAVSGTYFVLTSLYCLLAFLPYTFYFLIKAPAYAWMPWFVHHQALLYWLAAAAAVAANWRFIDSWRNRDRRFLSGAGLLAVAGLYLSVRPFLPGLQDNRSAYWWALAALLPLIAVALWKEPGEALDHAEGTSDNRPFAYSGGLLIAFVVSMVYVAGARFHVYHETRALTFHSSDAELMLWSLISHFVLAVVVLSIINLIFVLAAKTAKPQAVRRGVVGAAVFACLGVLLFRFLQDALGFGGWDARLYAASLALALTLWGFSLVSPFLEERRRAESPNTSNSRSSFQLGTWTALVASGLLAMAFPYLVGDADWSGFFQSTVTLLFWIAMSVCLFRLRPMRKQYSVLVLLTVLAASGVIYKSLQATEIFWSQPLGSTDDEISLTLEAYAGRDNSFQLAHHILGNSRNEVCGDLCRILRENTNIRDTRDRSDVQLVNHLTASPTEHPNVFVFVIDSMRPDYLGAYNPRVNYTPNMDAFARDSIVMHNVYTQYAGTSLSEPAIWSGAMMLHAHYLQPFSRLNSLDTMLHTDGYRMVVSVDEVLSAILPENDDLVRLDNGTKLWNALELGSTLRQAKNVLDAPENSARPIFFYTQPKNVHQFARNDVPSPTSQHWQAPEGMSIRISYEVHWVDNCLGEFFTYLKQRGMYDNSIIIITSDHGDATGEFGRMSHSTSIWPEIMRVPLIIHLPAKMREHLVYDDTRLSTLTDITPTLYYLLGHRPIVQNPLYGRPLFAETKQELDRYPRQDLLLASDVRAVYGILTADGRYLYTTYDSPAQSYLFDLATDANAEHSILTPALKQRYDEEIIEHLHLVGDFYGYKPGVGSLLASAH